MTNIYALFTNLIMFSVNYTPVANPLFDLENDFRTPCISAMILLESHCVVTKFYFIILFNVRRLEEIVYLLSIILKDKTIV